MFLRRMRDHGGRRIGHFLGGGATQSPAGASATAIAGLLPDPKNPSIFTWINRVIDQRRTNNAFNRTVNYYVDGSSGDDANPGTAFDQAFLGWDRLVSELNGLSDSVSVNVWLKRGTTIYGTAAFALTQNSLSIQPYGNASDVPEISFFSNSLASGSALWALDSGTMYVANAEDVAWLRKRVAWNPATELILRRRSSTVSCGNTANSFYVDTGSDLVYLNLGGTDPNTFTWEWTKGEDVSHFFDIYSSRAYLYQFRVMGAMGRTAGNVTHGVALRGPTATAELYAREVDAFYTGYHAISHLATTGSVCTMEDCETGLFRPQAGGDSTGAVSYADNGGNECFWLRHRTRFGNLWEQGVNEARNLCTSIYAHSTGGNKVSWQVILGHTHDSNAQSAGNAAAFGDLPSSGGSRFSVKGLKFKDYCWDADYSSSHQTIINIGQADCVEGCNRYNSAVSTGAACLGVLGAGHVFACEIQATGSAGGFSQMFSATADAGEVSKCHLRFDGAGTIFGNGDDASQFATKTIRGNIFSCAGRSTYPGWIDKPISNPNFPAAGANQNGNAWCCTDPVPSGGGQVHATGQGAIGDPNKVVCAYPRVMGSTPQWTQSPLVNAVDDGGVGYDVLGNPTNGVKTIGPRTQLSGLMDYTPGVDGATVHHTLNPDNYFTDTACTTPAVVGNAVAGWRDTDHTNATQATVGARPTMRSDGLEFGAGKSMVLAVTPNTSMEIFAQVTRTTGETLWLLGGASSPDPDPACGPHATNVVYWVQNSNQEVHETGPTVALTDDLAWFLRDVSTPVTVYAETNGGGVVLATGAGTAGNTDFGLIGSSATAGDSTSTCRIHGLWITGLLTDEQRQDMMDYLQSGWGLSF